MGGARFVLFEACDPISDDLWVIIDWETHNFSSFSACFSTISDVVCCRYGCFEGLTCCYDSRMF